MDPCNLNQKYNVDEDDYASQMRPEVEVGMDWAPASTDSKANSEWVPSTEAGVLHSTGIIQRRPRPVGQFQNAVVKPILPFLNNLYLRAQRMQHLARNVHVFHMQSIYIARQALHLVLRLNDAVDVNAGPSDEQYDGRNELEDELIELFEAMTEWGRDKGDEFQYDHCIFKIKEQYALLFKDRFYFHDARDGSTDSLYQKSVAYDEKTIRYRQCQRTHVTSSTTVEINCWTEPLEGEDGSEDETGRLVDGTEASAPSARSGGSKVLAHQPSTRASKSSFSLRNCYLKRKHRAIATIRIHLAVTQLHVAQIGVRKHGRRYRCRWESEQRYHTSASLPLDPFIQPGTRSPTSVCNARLRVPRLLPPPFGHAFQDSADGPVANAGVRLITAYRAGETAWPPNPRIEPDELLDVEPDSPLRSDYEQAMTHATHADKEYQRELRSLLQTFPQGEGEVPARPIPEQMQPLFQKVLYRDQVRTRGKGSRGGAKHYQCKWSACPPMPEKRQEAHEYGPQGHPSSFYDPEARSSPNPDFEDRGFLEEEVSAFERLIDSNVTLPLFCPAQEDQLFPVHDVIVGADCEVHPTARLLYDSLPQEYRDVFKNCRVYLERHLELVKYLRYLSLDDSDKRNESSSERDPIKSPGIWVPMEEGDKKKWQCGVVGCEYKGTFQHLVSHLRTRSHIGIRTFVCTLGCKMLFHQCRDRDRHVKDMICLEPRLVVEDAVELLVSTRSVREVPYPLTVGPGPIRTRRQLARGREYQIPAQTGVQGIPFISSAPPQPFSNTRLHLTHTYHQLHSNVPTTQDRRVGMHPSLDVYLNPYFVRTPSTLPMGGRHGTVITNHNHIYGMGYSQPTSNPQVKSESQPVKPEFNHPNGLTHGRPGFDIRGQDSGQSSTSRFTNFAGDFSGDNIPQRSHRGAHGSRQPLPYEGEGGSSSAHCGCFRRPA